MWDTAGQERFRTLTSSYYRGAHGLIFVYDLTRRETFTNLAETWQREVALYSTIEGAVQLVLGNKLDLEGERAVSRAEGVAFAKTHGALFLEVSARSRANVQEAFLELVSRVVDSPVLHTAPEGARLRLDADAQPPAGGACGC